jgi:predicted RNase H-like HicB family nuclease
MKYAVIFEKGDTSYGAYVPDLPGCVAVGETLEEVQRLIRGAMTFHLAHGVCPSYCTPHPRVIDR